MTLQKPNFNNSDYNVPSTFAQTNPKAPFGIQDVIDGYGTIGSLGLIPKGANYNFTIDLLFQWLTFLDKTIKITSGNPNGQVVAEVGALCVDNVSGKVYKKQSGVGNTGWIDMEAGAIPIGVYVPFAGRNLPSGFLWCDGSSYTTTDYPQLFAEIQYDNGNDNGKFKVPDLRERIPVGQGSDTVFDTIGKTGGAKTVALTVNQLPTHNHTASSASGGDHSHISTSSSTGNHTHTVSVSLNGNHTHTGTIADNGNHAHGVNDPSHAHVYNAVQGGNSQSGQEHHRFSDATGDHVTTYAKTGISIIPAGTHTHTLLINEIAGHDHTVTLSNNGNHSHDITINNNGAHTHTITVNNTGANESHSNIQPYIVCRYIIRAF